jgi:dienelactone hydrolase
MRAAHRASSERFGDAVPVGAVGHCFGGLAVLELARSGADVRAVASVHGGSRPSSRRRTSTRAS